MFYKEYKPPGILKEYIRCIWIQESNVKSDFLEKEKILPDGCVELIFDYGVPFKIYFSDHSFEIQPRGFIVTQMNHYIEIQPTGPIGTIAVRFSPGGLIASWAFRLKKFMTG